MLKQVLALQVVFISSFLALGSGTGTSYYCSENAESVTIAAESSGLEGTIITRYEGTGNYDNNMKCSWTLTAPANHRIQLIVQDTHLQWTPENVICNGYDYMEIFNGKEKSSKQLVSWCGEMNPGIIITTGNTAHITFQTNDRNIYTYRGITLKYQSFADSNCPPGWTSSPDDQYCYYVRDSLYTFQDAQQHCKYSQSNLASLKTNTVVQFVIDVVKNQSKVEVLWTGLNDILSNGNFVWLDGTKASKNRNWRDIENSFPNEFYECVSLDVVRETWQEQYCRNIDVKSQKKFPFICQMNKGGSTMIYKVPDPNKITKPPSSPGKANVWIAIGVSVGAVILILVVISVIIYIKFKRPTTRAKPGRRPPTQHDAPPTYTEATTM